MVGDVGEAYNMKVGIPVEQRYNKTALIIGFWGTVLGSIILWISHELILGVIGFVLIAGSWIISVKFVSKAKVSRPVPPGPNVVETSHGFYQGDNAIQEAINDLDNGGDEIKLR